MMHVEMDDKQTFDVTPMAQDAQLFVTTAARRGWGDVSGSPLLRECFIVWAALRRENQIELELEEFITSVARTSWTD